MMRILNADQIFSFPDCFYPMVVLGDNRKRGWSSFFGRQIKMHTKGQYSHAMWMRRPGMVISQDWHLAEKSVQEYLTDWYRLKFFTMPDMEETDETKINQCLDQLLQQGGRYDWLGIIGHLLHIRKLNFSNRYYCSEFVWEPFVEVWGYPRIYPSPSELDFYLPKIGWEIAGVYDTALLPGA